MLKTVVAIPFLFFGLFEASSHQIATAAWSLGRRMVVGSVKRLIEACSTTDLKDGTKRTTVAIRFWQSLTIAPCWHD